MKLDKFSKLSLLAAGVAMPMTPLVAQDATQQAEAVEQEAPAKPVVVPVDRQPVMEVVADPLAAQDEPEIAEPEAPLMWSEAQAQALYDFMVGIGAEGLDPADYPIERLKYGLESGNALVLSSAANFAFDHVIHDVLLGHTPKENRVDWHIVDTDLDSVSLNVVRAAALAAPDMGQWLLGQLPTHPQYAALKNALRVADPEDAELVAKIRTNLDRWRWMPRDLGDRYIIVNVPAYTAALVKDGKTISRHKAVAGAKATPTPQLMAEATGVIFNPYWNVPKSIEPEVRGKPGYEAIKADDGSIIRYRQPPGPSNALGQVKFVMYNPHLIYLHDTNARGLFDTQNRAYSHGCIRTENILKLATMLLEEDGGDWSPEKTVDVVNSGENTGAKFVKPLPVYIVYMSAAAKPDGGIVEYEDIYSRDGKVLAALGDAQSEERMADLEAAIAEGGSE
ncbi:L,D-transpeptidase family protein [Sphingomicrobium clamense]|uniref:L,D-transpeptidase family protein n=1 Tax=Sphingomicrobium clamense TaxID=2851013 RepID=A0ABS6V2G5_9SPHN|nr:L,D-transpeptidase family protein [Sphingomicrobium sp. B8]MBW0143758.1 L,D-transpeptidase family protein [Sphingomicrobium sp. B8]